MPRIIVALTLANGGLVRPECRTFGCPWHGKAWRTRPLAEIERARHQRLHAAAARRAPQGNAHV